MCIVVKMNENTAMPPLLDLCSQQELGQTAHPAEQAAVFFFSRAYFVFSSQSSTAKTSFTHI